MAGQDGGAEAAVLAGMVELICSKVFLKESVAGRKKALCHKQFLLARCQRLNCRQHSENNEVSQGPVLKFISALLLDRASSSATLKAALQLARTNKRRARGQQLMTTSERRQVTRYNLRTSLRF